MSSNGRASSNLLTQRKDEFRPKETFRESTYEKPQEFTSVRVSKETKEMLKALMSVEKEKTVDKMIHQLAGFYVNDKFTDSEKEKFNTIFSILKEK